jgi:hypothetical protein
VKKYFQSGIILLLLVWLFGALIYLPSTEGKLNAAAKEKLQHADQVGVFEKVKAEFKGQEAQLSGYVATAAEKTQAAELIKSQIRLAGWFTSPLNPVTAVHNNIEINPDKAPPRPRPWLIVSLFGDNQRVDGVLQSAAQRLDILAAIATKLPPPATPLNNQITISEKSLAAADWDATHSRIPDLTATTQAEATVAATACDGQWTRFPATVSNADIAAALKSSSIQDYEITHALAKLRSWKFLTPEELKQQAEAEAEAKAKAAAKGPASANKALGPFIGPNGAPARPPR